MIGHPASPLAADQRAMNGVVAGDTHDPHATLGAHPSASGEVTIIRTLRKAAEKVSVIVGDERTDMVKVHDDGIFAAEVPGTVLDYRLDVDGTVADDPYRHLPTLGELDLHLIGEGRHEKLWRVLGAQPHGTGVGFAVWAPSARGVQVVGDFVGWGPYDGWPMRSLGSSGGTSTGRCLSRTPSRSSLRTSARMPSNPSQVSAPRSPTMRQALSQLVRGPSAHQLPR